jgi:hypothetical protein
MSLRYNPSPPGPDVFGRHFAGSLTQNICCCQWHRENNHMERNNSCSRGRRGSAVNRVVQAFQPAAVCGKGLLIFHLAIYDPIWLQLLKCPMSTWLWLAQQQWIQLCLHLIKPWNKSPAWSSWPSYSQTHHLSNTHISWLTSCPPTRTTVRKDI